MRWINLFRVFIFFIFILFYGLFIAFSKTSWSFFLFKRKRFKIFHYWRGEESHGLSRCIIWSIRIFKTTLIIATLANSTLIEAFQIEFEIWFCTWTAFTVLKLHFCILIEWTIILYFWVPLNDLVGNISFLKNLNISWRLVDQISLITASWITENLNLSRRLIH